MRDSQTDEFSGGGGLAHRDWRSVSFGQDSEDVVGARGAEEEVKEEGEEEVLREDLEAFSKAMREEFELKVECY